MTAAALLAVATASPPHVIDQAAAAEAARAVFAHRFRDFDRLFPVFANTGIETRQAVRPMDWYATPRTWPERTTAYLEGATELFIAAARKALDKAGVAAGEVDTVVTVSSTGIATPSLEARAMGVLGLKAGISRVPVFGLGCAGGVTGLAIAARLAAARPGAIVLLVCVELCTLAARHDQLTPANLVATALFGDGAAACVVQAGANGLGRIAGAAEHTWPDTLRIMGWNVDETGFGVVFDRSIPAFATAHLRAAMEGLLARMEVEPEAVGRFVCHPGGAKVIEALEASLELHPGALDLERAVLADHGNMSAPTVLFVLERALNAGAAGPVVLSALGPGFTASALRLDL